jgi:hypothetical protein
MRHLTTSERASIEAQIQSATSISAVLRVAHSVRLTRVPCGYRVDVNVNMAPAFTREEETWFRGPVREGTR